MGNFLIFHSILIVCELVFVVGGDKIEQNWKKRVFCRKMENPSIFVFSSRNRFPETRHLF